ncbi:hypothetical protein LCGC14_2246350 [marine sediment metagenome]|uniref:Uncharacterized protein n=1 Tax=marine sediment metagenome TaxID=412755 RepID=A0A0F9FGI3_9ZZZZ
MIIPEDLIPTIEIGKKYLWKSSPIELLCPTCRVNEGNSMGDFTFECIVLSPTKDFICNSCNVKRSSPEGWYNVRALDNGELGSVPYTQLEPLSKEIEEEI